MLRRFSQEMLIIAHASEDQPPVFSAPGHANVVGWRETWGIRSGTKPSNNKPSPRVPSELTSKKPERYRFDMKLFMNQEVRNAA